MPVAPGPPPSAPSASLAADFAAGSPVEPTRRCVVVVLGDLGRSPRMLLQATSLAHLACVDLVGYAGAELPGNVRNHPRITVHRLPVVPSMNPARGSLLWLDAAARLSQQTVRVARLLLSLPRAELVLVQNPPALPTLAVAWLVARLRRSRWAVDWHNLSFSVLALKLGEAHRGVALARWCEIFWGRRADAHLCVSRELRDALMTRWRIGPAQVLYDRPPLHLATSVEDSEELLRRLLHDLDLSPRDGSSGTVPAALGTSPGCRRPAVVVSPTSWTLDEDYDLLLDALDLYQQAIPRARAAGASIPPLAILLTGEGPLRREYETRFRNARWSDVRVRTAWLPPEDYRGLLGAADLGLCLHRSSSGLDLPMKVADMLGEGLPVCALRYGSVQAEQLRSGVQGRLFADAPGLGELLIELLRGFPSSGSALQAMRASLREHPVERWDEGWEREGRPLFVDLLG